MYYTPDSCLQSQRPLWMDTDACVMDVTGHWMVMGCQLWSEIRPRWMTTQLASRIRPPLFHVGYNNNRFTALCPGLPG